jgi:hypothetical protein
VRHRAPSLLAPSSVALLRDVRARAPVFSSIMSAELFDAEHTRGRYKVLPRVDGGYVVFDAEAPLSAAGRERWPSLESAHAELERLARRDP